MEEEIEVVIQGARVQGMRKYRQVTVQQVADALEKTDAFIEDIENAIEVDYFDFVKFLEFYHFGIFFCHVDKIPDWSGPKMPKIKDEGYVWTLGKELVMPENRPNFSTFVKVMRMYMGFEIEEIAQKVGKTVEQIEKEENNRFMCYHDWRTWADFYSFAIKFLPKEYLPLDEPEPDPPQ